MDSKKSGLVKFVKFEFNDIKSLYTKNDSDSCQPIILGTYLSMAFDDNILILLTIVINVIYFTIRH